MRTMLERASESGDLERALSVLQPPVAPVVPVAAEARERAEGDAEAMKDRMKLMLEQAAESGQLESALAALSPPMDLKSQPAQVAEPAESEKVAPASEVPLVVEQPQPSKPAAAQVPLVVEQPQPPKPAAVQIEFLRGESFSASPVVPASEVPLAVEQPQPPKPAAAQAPVAAEPTVGTCVQSALSALDAAEPLPAPPLPPAPAAEAKETQDLALAIPLVQVLPMDAKSAEESQLEDFKGRMKVMLERAAESGQLEDALSALAPVGGDLSEQAVASQEDAPQWFKGRMISSQESRVWLAAEKKSAAAKLESDASLKPVSRPDSRSTSVIVANVKEVRGLYEDLHNDNLHLHTQVDSMAQDLEMLKKENLELRDKLNTEPGSKAS